MHIKWIKKFYNAYKQVGDWVYDKQQDSEESAQVSVVAGHHKVQFIFKEDRAVKEGDWGWDLHNAQEEAEWEEYEEVESEGAVCVGVDKGKNSREDTVNAGQCLKGADYNIAWGKKAMNPNWSDYIGE